MTGFYPPVCATPLTKFSYGFLLLMVYSLLGWRINGLVRLLNSTLFGLICVFLCHLANPPITNRLESIMISAAGVPLAAELIQAAQTRLEPLAECGGEFTARLEAAKEDAGKSSIRSTTARTFSNVGCSIPSRACVPRIIPRPCASGGNTWRTAKRKIGSINKEGHIFRYGEELRYDDYFTRQYHSCPRVWRTGNGS